MSNSGTDNAKPENNVGRNTPLIELAPVRTKTMKNGEMVFRMNS